MPVSFCSSVTWLLHVCWVWAARMENEPFSQNSTPLTKENLKENRQTPRDIRMSDNTTLAPPASNQGPTTPRKGPPKFKQRQTRQFKSKPPKKGVKGFGDDIPGMEGLGTDITVICPWEAFSHLELHELAQFGII
ncbi:retinal cone rhodopsin-sensitive cGMP 3',5'-cyclic phosphodiesterase subunit gamma isoform X1 [Vulpes vulpes]|uniref:Retinal cone rhodopsin-sensitive cGMP 3',5'-cyclic phosphodiesterase subunit gamma n=1 Tax=Vulpes vulpes TaxID=9627 RepID=A0A3Q7S7Y4_VULVU